MESIPHAISVHDRERNLVFSNPACAALIGYDTEEFADLEHEQLFHPRRRRTVGNHARPGPGHGKNQRDSTSANPPPGRPLDLGARRGVHVHGRHREVGRLVLQDESDTIWGNPTAARQPIR